MVKLNTKFFTVISYGKIRKIFSRKLDQRLTREIIKLFFFKFNKRNYNNSIHSNLGISVHHKSEIKWNKVK